MPPARNASAGIARWATVLGLFVGWSASGQSPASPPPYKPVFSRERSFRIPYDVNPADQARLKEVQLGYSTDRGANWRPHGAGPVPQGREYFTFTAPADGEYWFAVRTVDFEGRGDPPSFNGTPPQLVVVVDTTPPLLSFRALSPSGDEAGASWEIQDVNIDPRSIRMDFRAGSADWFPVTVPPQPSGSTRFKTGTRGPVQLRMRVLDLAGNETTEEINLQPAAGPQAPSNAQGGVPAFGPPANSPPASNNGAFTVPPPPNINVPLGSPGGLIPPASGASPDAGWSPAPGARPQSPASQGSSAFSGSTPPAGPLSQSAPPTMPGIGLSPPNGQLLPPASNPRSSAPPPPTGQLVSQPAAPPVRQNLQLVNSTKFAINYDLEEVGRSGVSAVGLYWTYDGNTWNYHGDDDDRQSPFPVEVDAEGVFGFKMIARSGAGLGDDPPQPGDAADVWVEVDITPPEVDLRPPQPGKGASAGILDIQWQARDKNLAPKPIGLFYAEQPTGPWFAIAEGIENSGRFQWEIPNDPKMPYKFFVRLECRDRAGNVGRAETPTAVVVDLMKPRIKVKRVEPAVKSTTPDLTIDPLPK